MNASDMLDSAKHIMEERGKVYDCGTSERSMAKTVAAFNAVTGKSLTEVEGWFFMECLKGVRFFTNQSKPHHDSLLDSVAYTALRAEAALKK